MDSETASPSGASERRLAVRHGPLRPSELAEAAVLGDLALVMEVIGWFAPVGIAGIFQALAVVPFAVLAGRHRLRAALVSAVSASTVAALVGGIGIMVPVAIASGLGISVGIVYRRRWSPVAGIGFTILIVGVPLAALTDLLDVASAGYRKLSFDQVKIVWKIVADLLHAIGLSSVQRGGNSLLDWAIAHWWISLPIAEIAIIALIALGCVRLRVLLAEIHRHVPVPVLDEAVERRPRRGQLGAPAAEAVPQPVPVRLEDVSYRYPGAVADAITNVSLELRPGSFLAVVGPNGCGKSTLVRVLAGRLDPTSGSVERPGPAGLGRIGGTAIVFQRPESQVLGVRVRDDVLWGLPSSSVVDVGDLLRRVGLDGFEDRETSTMSGGELQRLAIAAALARSPRLLVSDEATAMIDRPGRQEVVALLRALAASGIAVIHVTHRLEEAALADAVLDMTPTESLSGVVARTEGARGAGGAGDGASGLSALSPKPIRRFRPISPRLVRPSEPRPELLAPQPVSPGPITKGAPLVSLDGVGYVYAARSPWEHRALEGIDLQLCRGEGVVLTGPNGSGKSTLAWLLAGLAEPTEGTALLEGEPISDQPGRVGISFQHARLQLLRPRVLADVSLGADAERARRALRSVGLDPEVMGPRRVDDLSGGEQRRVALAGMLVKEPDLIVLDEPYAGLDDDARVSLARILERLRRLSGVAVVVVTHDLDNAEALGGRLIHLEDGRLRSEVNLPEHW